MTYHYGSFTENQMTEEKRRLHSMIHYLLVYKQCKDSYPKVDLNDYFETVMCEMGGLNHLLGEPEGFVELMVLLQSAHDEALRANCDEKLYRRLILDAHATLDEILDSDGDDDV